MEKSNKALEPYNIEKIEISLKWKGNKQKLLVAQRGKKTDIRLKERDTEYKKPNPNLIFICNLGNGKVYYNNIEDEFWLMSRRLGSQEVIWTKIENHDFETMLAIGILNRNQFDSTKVRKALWLRKSLENKIELFNDRFHKKKLRKRR